MIGDHEVQKAAGFISSNKLVCSLMDFFTAWQSHPDAKN